MILMKTRSRKTRMKLLIAQRMKTRVQVRSLPRTITTYTKMKMSTSSMMPSLLPLNPLMQTKTTKMLMMELDYSKKVYRI